jgi:hypothetical protein
MQIMLVRARWRGAEAPYEQKSVDGDVVLRNDGGDEVRRIRVRCHAPRFSTLVEPVGAVYIPHLDAGAHWLIPFRIVSLQAESRIEVSVEYTFERCVGSVERAAASFELGPSARGMDGMVFISYATADLRRVRPFIEHLHFHGIRTWMAEADLRYGDWFPVLIREAIANVRAFIVFLSHASVASGWVRDEIQLAITHRETDGNDGGRSRANRLEMIVPVVLDDTSSPEWARVCDPVLAWQLGEQAFDIVRGRLQISGTSIESGSEAS